MNSRKYVILTAAEAANINYDQVLESSADTLRWNNDNTKTFIKWEGTVVPDVADGKTQFNHTEMLAILNSPSGGWVSDPHEGAN